MAIESRIYNRQIDKQKGQTTKAKLTHEQQKTEITQTDEERVDQIGKGIKEKDNFNIKNQLRVFQVQIN